MVFAYNSKNEIDYKYNCQVPLRWLSCKEFTSHMVDRGSIPGGNRPDSEMTDEPRHSRFGKLKKTSLLLNGYMSSNCRSPAGISTLNQRWINVAHQRWILVAYESWGNVETSTLFQRQISTLNRRWKLVDFWLKKRW